MPYIIKTIGSSCPACHKFTPIDNHPLAIEQCQCGPTISEIELLRAHGLDPEGYTLKSIPDDPKGLPL